MGIEVLDAPCDRCGKVMPKLLPYYQSPVVYKGKRIETPWLCRKCFMVEKRKAWGSTPRA